MARADTAELVRQAIGRWRDDLVNLTGNNRLLNFKPGRTASIEVADPNLQGKLIGLLTGAEFGFRSLDAAEPAEEELRRGEQILFSRAPQADLQAALRSLMRKSNQEYLDRGVWVLHLAFGALTWSDEKKDGYTSPLVLVPVKLTGSARRTPRLTLAEDDPTPNPALALRLAALDVEMPTFDDLETLNLGEYFAAVREAIATSARVSGEDRSGWQVVPTLHLSCFSFAKEAMYRDLQENEDLIAGHEGIQALALGPTHGGKSFDFDEIPDERIDELAPAYEIPLVLDADSSQRACVAAALDGRSFVMDGPPGTGKSQTISNMIGALLHAGKSVLFVSEKAAALDVVHNRLADAGLGSFLLELHSHKATRKEVATALGEALDQAEQADTRTISKSDRQQLKQRQEELNAYAAAMNSVREPLGLSLHEVLGRLAHLREAPAVPVQLKGLGKIDRNGFAEIQKAASGLGRSWRPALEGESFRWRGVTARTSMDATLYQVSSALTALTEALADHADLASAFRLAKLSDAEKLLELIHKAAARPAKTPREWITTPYLADTKESLAQLRAELERLAVSDERADRACGMNWRTVRSLPPMEGPEEEFANLTSRILHDLAGTFTNAGALIKQRRRNLEEIATALFLPVPTTLDDATMLLDLADIATLEARPETEWFTREGHQQASQALDALKAAGADARARRDAAAAIFTPPILTVDLNSLVDGFTQPATGLRKLFGGQPRKDYASLQGLVHDPSKAEEAAQKIHLARQWQDADRAWQQALQTQGPALGAYFQGPQTNFALISTLLAVSENALSIGVDVSRAGTVLGNGKTPPNWLPELVAQIKQDLDGWRAQLVPSSQPGMPLHLAALPLEEITEWLDSRAASAKSAATRAESVSQDLNRDLTAQEAEAVLQAVRETRDEHAAFAKQDERWASHLGELYQGEQTHLAEVDEALAWAEVCVPTASPSPIPRPILSRPAFPRRSSIPRSSAGKKRKTSLWTRLRTNVVRICLFNLRTGNAPLLFCAHFRTTRVAEKSGSPITTVERFCRTTASDRPWNSASTVG